MGYLSGFFYQFSETPPPSRCGFLNDNRPYSKVGPCRRLINGKRQTLNDWRNIPRHLYHYFHENTTY